MWFRIGAFLLWLTNAGGGYVRGLNGEGRAVIHFTNQSGRALERIEVAVDDTPVYTRAPPDDVEVYDGSLPDGSYMLDVTVRRSGRAPVHASLRFQVPPMRWLLLDAAFGRDGRLYFSSRTKRNRLE